MSNSLLLATVSRTSLWNIWSLRQLYDKLYSPQMVVTIYNKIHHWRWLN